MHLLNDAIKLKHLCYILRVQRTATYIYRNNNNNSLFYGAKIYCSLFEIKNKTLISNKIHEVKTNTRRRMIFRETNNIICSVD